MIRDLLYTAAMIAAPALLLAAVCAAGPLADMRAGRRRSRQHRPAHTSEGVARLRDTADTVTFPAAGACHLDEATQAWMRSRAIRRGVRLVAA
jgi:hypothetical protein